MQTCARGASEKFEMLKWEAFILIVVLRVASITFRKCDRLGTQMKATQAKTRSFILLNADENEADVLLSYCVPCLLIRGMMRRKGGRW